MNEAHQSPRTSESHREHGFTLLELLVVVLILGLLAAYVGPKYFSQLGRSEATIARSQITSFERALDAYRVDVGQYPSTEQGLMALYRNPGNLPRWNGPYLAKEPPPDPWGRPYRYRSPGQGGKDYEVVSLGKDGQTGGDGDNADIAN
jgi:general secretion pathway protein G